MSIIYTQTDTLCDADCDFATEWGACSGLTSNSGPNCSAISGGTAGSTSRTLGMGSSETRWVYAVASIDPGTGVTWGAGNWTVRLNVTTANMNITWTDAYICRVNSSCVNQATIGNSSGLGVSLGTTGVKSAVVAGSSQSPSAGDFVLVAYAFTNGAMSAQNAAVTWNQDIDSPFSQVTPSLVWDTLSALRHLLVRKVFDFGRLAPAWSRRPSGLIVPRAANDDQIKLAA